MTPCAFHQPTSRAERRRLEREIEATRPAPGAGQWWRLSVRGRRYQVVEPRRIDLDRMIAESDAAAERLGCTCLVATEAVA